MGGHDVRGLSVMEQQRASYSNSFNNARRVTSMWSCGMRGTVFDRSVREVALLSRDFPLNETVGIGCDDKAALPLCKDRKQGQPLDHIDVICYFARDHLASGEMVFEYCIIF
jgi:hypothetical protein